MIKNKLSCLQSGFGALGLMLILLVISFISFTGYMVYQNRSDDEVISNKSSKSEEDSSASAKSSKQLLQILSDEFAELNPAVNNDQDSTVAVDFYIEKFDNKEDIESVVIPSDLYINFTEDTKSIYEDMIAIMTNNGFTATGTITSDEYDYHIANYTSNDARCNFHASIYYGRINCISESSYDVALDEVTAIAEAIAQEKQLNPINLNVTWITSPSDDDKAISVYYADSETGNYSTATMYFYKLDDADWISAGESQTTSTSSSPALCSELRSPDTKDLFKNTECQ